MELSSTQNRLLTAIKRFPKRPLLYYAQMVRVDVTAARMAVEGLIELRLCYRDPKNEKLTALAVEDVPVEPAAAKNPALAEPPREKSADAIHPAIAAPAPAPQKPRSEAHIATMETRANNLALRPKILEALKSGSKSTIQITQIVGGKTVSIGVTLSWMARAGQVVRTGPSSCPMWHIAGEATTLADVVQKHTEPAPNPLRNEIAQLSAKLTQREIDKEWAPLLRELAPVLRGNLQATLLHVADYLEEVAQ